MLDQNLKCFKRYCQGNDRTCYRLGENVCKNMYLIRDWYPEYIKNSHKSEIRKQMALLFKVGQNIWKGTSLKKRCEFNHGGIRVLQWKPWSIVERN